MVKKISIAASALAALALTTTLALRGTGHDGSAQLVPEPAAEPERPRIEREALARFGASKPRIRMPDGTEVDPSNQAHADAIKLRAYENLLVREEAERDPAFALRAEEELERRRPLHATLRWDDLTGNREAVFVVDDSSRCDLSEEEGAFQVSPQKLGQHPCLNQLGDLGTDAVLNVQLAPVTRGEPLWGELLRGTMRALAAEAHLARAQESESI